MNEYGRRVMNHWRRFLPTRYSQLENPTEFFSDQGEQIADQVTAACASLERAHAQELRGLDYLQRVGLLNNLRMQATEVAMSDFLPEPEPTEAEQAQMLRERRAQEVSSRMREVMDKDGMPLDREHRLWAMLEDEDVTPQQFAAASLAWEEQTRTRIEAQVDAQAGTPTQD